MLTPEQIEQYRQKYGVQPVTQQNSLTGKTLLDFLKGSQVPQEVAPKSSILDKAGKVNEFLGDMTGIKGYGAGVAGAADVLRSDSRVQRSGDRVQQANQLIDQALKLPRGTERSALLQQAKQLSEEGSDVADRNLQSLNRAPNAKQMAGSTAKLGLTVGTAAYGIPKSIGGKLAEGAAVGSAFGGAEALEDDASLRDTAVSAGVGGAIGAGTGLALPVIGAGFRALKGVPNRLSSFRSGVTEQTVNKLERDYDEWLGATKAGVKKIGKIDAKTQALNKSGVVAQTPQRVLAESGVVPRTEGTKFRTMEQANEFRDKIKPLNEINNAVLLEVETSTQPLVIDQLKAKTRRRINQLSIPASDKRNLLRDVDMEYDLWKEKYGDTITISDLGQEKSIYWKPVKFDATRPFKNDANYAIAKSAQETIEETARAAGFEDVAQLNRNIGDRLEAAKVLESLDGQTLKGGRVGKYVLMGIGSTLGNSVSGKILGALGGDMVADILMKSSVSTPVKRLILRKLEKQNPRAYQAAVQWLQEQGMERELRLLLPEPKPLGSPENPIVPPYTEYEPQAKQIFNQRLKGKGEIPATTDEMMGGVAGIERDEDGNLRFNPEKAGLGILGIKGAKKVSKTSAFEGFDDLSTKVLEKLKGRTKVSKQFISDLTNSPDLKQAERDVIRKTLAEYGDDPLLSEARKYKSAEEFVKAQGTPAYRGDSTPVKLSEMDTTKVFNPAEKEALGAFNNTPGLYFTDSIDNAKSYGKNLTEVSISPTAKVINVNDAPKILKRADVEKIIRSNPRIEDWAMNWDENLDKAIRQITDSVMAEKDGNEFLKAIWSDGGFSESDFVEAMQKAGIDGLKVPKEGVNHFVIYNKDALQTKSQLTDIWNKAQKDEIDVSEFANRVKSELLPLESSDLARLSRESESVEIRPRYENITLPDELRGPVANYDERIYSSPISTSAGNVHFDSDSFPNYFAHSRIEDLPRIVDSGVPSQFDKGKNIEVIHKEGGDTRRVIEIQSDLFQKGRLEGDVQLNNDTLALRELGLEREHDDLLSRARSLTEKERKRLDEIQAQMKNYKLKDYSKLEPYRNTWHERVIREEVKQAAVDGKTKLQFPTGETAMKIEGLGDNTRWYIEGGDRQLTPGRLSVGREIIQGNDEYAPWIITDVLGDGKFKAIQKSDLDFLSEDLSKLGLMGPDDAVDAITNKDGNVLNLLNERANAESFDISGKVDTNNPIYKFYEKEVGRYLKNKYGAELVTDPQGVKWWEVKVSPEKAKAPVEAFGLGAIPLLDDED